MNTLRLTAFLVVVALSSSSVVQSPNKQDTFELLILHNNDMHARFEQTSQLSGTCTTADREAGKCYGGFPRVAHVVKEARKAAASGEGPPVLYLNAGDTYTGTAWFTIYKWKIAAEFLNALQPDAVSLSKSDLDGESGLSSFLNSINSPIIATNVILNKEQSNKFEKSTIFDVEGTKVGIVGYITPSESLLQDPGSLEYIDEVIALKEEVNKLIASNVNVIIALGSSNIEKDIEIAREVDGIDLVIGGYKNTFFLNGRNAEPDLPTLNEPVIITQSSGKTVPVIQSYSYDKYLGNITVRFDKNGEVSDFTVNPVLLDNTILQDSEVTEIIDDTKLQMSTNIQVVIGRSAVVLDGEKCGSEECNLGNLIADAMSYYNAIQSDGVWTNAPITIIHSGAIAGTISPENRPAFVSNLDLFSVLPLESNLRIVNMSGSVLNELLEFSALNYSIKNPIGTFLQYSGVRVVYNMTEEPGSRLVSALVRSNGFVPEFYPINENWSYSVLMPAALADGQFGYSMLVDLPSQNLEFDEITSLFEYIQQRSPVYPEISDRIVLRGLDDFEEPKSSTAKLCSTIMTLLIILVPLFI